jgi:hypothetical protein
MLPVTLWARTWADFVVEPGTIGRVDGEMPAMVDGEMRTDGAYWVYWPGQTQPVIVEKSIVERVLPGDAAPDVTRPPTGMFK